MIASKPDPPGQAWRDPAAASARPGLPATAVPTGLGWPGPPGRDLGAPFAGPGREELAAPDPAEPSAAQMAEQEAILAAEIAAGIFEPPPGDVFAGLLADPDTGPPDGAGAWLAELASPARDAILDARAAAAVPAAEAPFPAGVIGHEGTGPGGTGFADGSVLDRLGPGPVLAAALDDTWQAGLDRLSEDELAGLVLAWRRCESRAAAGLLAGTAELSRRRMASGDWRVIEHTDNELALLLTLTRRSAGSLLAFATSLARLPATAAALATGQIDRDRADVIAYETALLDDALAAAVEQLVIEDAPRLTTSKLRARLRRAVLAADPAAARRRAEQAARDARVELHDERSGGTAALSGRDLPVPAALAADQRIDAAAKALKASGVPATLPQLRAAVFLGLLTGHDPLTFLPPPDDTSDCTLHGDAARPASSAAEPGQDDKQPAASAGQDGTPATPGGPGTEAGQHNDQPRPAPGQDPAAEDSAGPPAWTAGRPALRGSVHLTIPLAAWLGLTRSPGEITGFGPATAETCRDLADQIAANPGSRWCLTLTDNAGHAAGHGCARKPPPPPTDLAAITAWLTAFKTGPVEAGTCSHTREVPGYRMPDSLHHILKIRQKTCFNPICGHPAISSDDDHTLPYDQGGRSCECNGAPGCRNCHQTKQTPGWHLEQPSPGVLIWRTPHGRRYTVTPGVYPT
jgi:hypothetical protein